MTDKCVTHINASIKLHIWHVGLNVYNTQQTNCLCHTVHTAMHKEIVSDCLIVDEINPQRESSIDIDANFVGEKRYKRAVTSLAAAHYCIQLCWISSVYKNQIIFSLIKTYVLFLLQQERTFCMYIVEHILLLILLVLDELLT